MAFLHFYATRFAGLFVSPDTLTLDYKLSQAVRSQPSIVSFCSALLKTPRPVENNF